jgi:hypothetical protein
MATFMFPFFITTDSFSTDKIGRICTLELSEGLSCHQVHFIAVKLSKILFNEIQGKVTYD